MKKKAATKAAKIETKMEAKATRAARLTRKASEP